MPEISFIEPTPSAPRRTISRNSISGPSSIVNTENKLNDSFSSKISFQQLSRDINRSPANVSSVMLGLSSGCSSRQTLKSYKSIDLISQKKGPYLNTPIRFTNQYNRSPVESPEPIINYYNANNQASSELKKVNTLFEAPSYLEESHTYFFMKDKSRQKSIDAFSLNGTNEENKAEIEEEDENKEIFSFISLEQKEIEPQKYWTNSEKLNNEKFGGERAQTENCEYDSETLRNLIRSCRNELPGQMILNKSIEVTKLKIKKHKKRIFPKEEGYSSIDKIESGRLENIN